VSDGSSSVIQPSSRKKPKVFSSIRIDIGYNLGYTINMKTAISIPDYIFREAEKTAKSLGLSRSELYARAVLQFVEDFRNDHTTEALDRIFGKEDGELDSAIASMQASSIFQEDW
jgi:rRNA-processing protein FCF1